MTLGHLVCSERFFATYILWSYFVLKFFVVMNNLKKKQTIFDETENFWDALYAYVFIPIVYLVNIENTRYNIVFYTFFRTE